MGRQPSAGCSPYIAKPTIQIATDVIIKVTTASICGTDLHIYHGVGGGTEVPYPLGHEAVGIITSVGSAVTKFKVGDRVLVPTDPDPDELLVGPLSAWPRNIQQLRGLGNLLGNLGGAQCMLTRRAYWPSLTFA